MMQTRPSIDPSRREILTASAVGISTLMLPSAAAAASLPVSAAPLNGQVSYSGDVLLASWTSFFISARTSGDAGNRVFAQLSADYRLASVVADSNTDQRPNPNAFVGDGLNIPDGKIGFSGVSSRDWSVQNSSSGIDHTASPYVEYRLTPENGRTVVVRSLVLHSTRLGSNTALSLAFFRSSDGFATQNLRRTATHINEYRKIVVDLGGVTVAGGTTLAVRMYFYRTAGQNDVYVRDRDESGTGQPTPRTGLTTADTGQASENPSVAPASLPNAAVSFIGREVVV